jgi:tetratricopeptide (TPR) repeat protein
VLFRSEKYAEAENRVRKALEYGGNNNGVILEHCGDILFFLGRKQEALDYWKKAKTAGGASSVIDRKIETGNYLEEND